VHFGLIYNIEFNFGYSMSLTPSFPPMAMTSL